MVNGTVNGVQRLPRQWAWLIGPITLSLDQGFHGHLPAFVAC